MIGDHTSFGEHPARYKTAKGGTKKGILSVEKRWGQVHITLTTKERITHRLAAFVQAEWFNQPFAKQTLHRLGVTSWK